jgi:2-(1,2-epoxy-1,2-dihydrophenyl)acetyl-CoA isomerase
MSDYVHTLFDISDEIATITLNRPEAKNALSIEMREEIGDALRICREQAGEGVKAIIITGAGGAFCAGGDVKAMGQRDKSAVPNRTRMQSSHNRMMELMNIELPVIALVDGPAAGAGANIALAADFVLATPRAMFMQAFGRIGLVPDWSGFFVLPRLVGLQTAKDLVFTARKVRADEAKELGMVYKIVGQDTAMEEARAFAGRFRNASSTAIGIAKNILNQSFNHDHKTLLEFEAMGQAIAQTSEYHKEAVRRFREKEPSLFDWEAMDRAEAEVKKAAE